jgi:Opacity protein and related surface antigens
MRVAISTIALLACTSLASAADLGGPYEYEGSIKDAPIAAAPYNWTGLYFGVHGGWAGGSGWDGDFFNKGVALNYGYSLDADGWYGGFQAGANQQFGRLVAGIEVDVSFGDMSDNGMFQANNEPNPGSYVEWEIKQKLERFGTVRGRLGYLPVDNLLVYVTGGIAWGQTEASEVTHMPRVNPPKVTSTGSVEETHLGWTVGGGLEWVLTPNLSLRGEYLYVDLGEEDYHFVGQRTNGTYYADDRAPSDLDFHTVRLGLNYKFGH